MFGEIKGAGNLKLLVFSGALRLVAVTMIGISREGLL